MKNVGLDLDVVAVLGEEVVNVDPLHHQGVDLALATAPLKPAHFVEDD